MRGINKLSSWNLNYVKKLHISPLFKEFPREIYFRRCSFRSARLNEYEGPMPSFIWFNGSHQTQDRVFFRSSMIGDSDGCKRLSVQSLWDGQIQLEGGEVGPPWPASEKSENVLQTATWILSRTMMIATVGRSPIQNSSRLVRCQYF